MSGFHISMGFVSANTIGQHTAPFTRSVAKYAFEPSEHPRVAVVDYFDHKSIDIDGDQVDDLAHGEVVERFIKAQVPHAEIVRFELHRDAEGNQKPAEIVRQFENLRLRHRSGERFDAVNFSIGNPACFKGTSLGKTGLTPENIARHRKQFLKMMQNSQTTLQKTYTMVDAITRAIWQDGKKVLDVYMAGGNLGRDVFSMYNLAPGSIKVRATDAQGKVMSFSADNALLNRNARGVFTVTKASGGYDITGDGVADVFNDEVSGGKPLVANFQGKPINDVLATDDEIVQLFKGNRKVQTTRVASLKRLQELGYVSQEMYNTRVDLGQYVVFHQNSMALYMTTDSEGRLVLDSDHSGCRNAVNELRGTSYAAPFALGETLKKA
jgi:hypothetical protein